MSQIVRCFPGKQFTNHDLGSKLALERSLSFFFYIDLHYKKYRETYPLYLNKKK